MSVLAISSLSGFSEFEHQVAQRLLNQLGLRLIKNQVKWAYYEGEQRVRDLNISIPPSMRDVQTVVGWPSTTVDVLEERLDLEGWGGSDEGLDEIFVANHLDTESGQAHLDALICGVAFVAVGSGMAGEPNPLITIESPRNMTASYDARSRRLSAALSQIWDRERGRPSSITLYLPNETITADMTPNGQWMVVERDQHRLGRVPVARLVNKPRSSDINGRSEITRAVRGYTDNAVRTLLGMEVSREFYAAPQRYALGVAESAFVDSEGNPKTAWETYIGRVWALQAGQDDAGNETMPVVGQFPAGSMAPYVEQVRLLSQLLAAEAAIPASYLGFVTENPASADAIRQAEARLVKRAERRQRDFGASWKNVAELSLLIRDGQPAPPGMYVKWRDASTPTRAATTDAIVKLVQAGILPANSDVTYDLLGFTDQQRGRLAAEAAQGGAMDALLRELNSAQTPDLNGLAAG